MKRGKKAIVIGTLIAALLLAAGAYYFINMVGTYTFDAEAYQPYYKREIKYEEGQKLAVNNNGKIFEKATKEAVDIIPIYYKGQERLVLTEAMAYYNNYNRLPYKIDQFSEIKRDENGFIVADNGSESVMLEGGFLYNGDDIYIVLEPMTITVNGYHAVYPAFSYVEAVNGNGVITYDFETGKAYFEEPKLDVIAEPYDDTFDYSVSMLADSASFPGDFDLLLFTQVDKLDSIFDL